jgi:hypothetical protein
VTLPAAAIAAGVQATARYIIKNRSSLSDTALGFNPVDYTFILGPNDPVYSTDNMGQPPREVAEAVADSAAAGATTVIAVDGPGAPGGLSVPSKGERIPLRAER